MRLLKKDNLGVMRDFSLLRSDSDASEGVEGIRFDSLWMKPMSVMIGVWRYVERMDQRVTSAENEYCSRGAYRDVVDLGR